MKNHLPEGQELFNWIFGFLVVAITANLFWVNWKIIQPTVSRLPEECDFDCVRQEIGKVIAVELEKNAVPTPQPATTLSESCDRDCVVEIVDEKLAKFPNSVKATATAPVVKTTPKALVTKFVNLSGGSGAGTDWTQVSGTEFTLDTSLYSPDVTAFWEGHLSIQDGNGLGTARIYDITNNRGVDGSEAGVSGTDTISFYSGNLALWRGQNQYRLEVRSTTGYPVTISSARLKLIY